MPPLPTKELVFLKDLIEAGKEKLSERVATLKNTIPELRSFVIKVVETALWQSLVSTGVSQKEAKEFSDGWVGRYLKWVDSR